jgi:polysaccharide biosynthesis transport protein
LGDQAVASLNAQREELERRLADADVAGETEVELRTALAQVEADLEARSTEVLGGLTDAVADLEAEADTYRTSIREELLSGELSSDTVADLFSLQQEASIARDQYQTLLSRLRELEAQASVQVADSRIVSEALPPQGPAFPNKKLLLALALVAGLGLGVALAFANEFYVGGVTSPSQLGIVAQAEVATSLPLQGQAEGTRSVADLLVQAPLSIYSEAVRKLRASVDEARFRHPGGTTDKAFLVLVGSSIPAEGKSTTAVALARAYATSGKRVLLVDADLRKPSIHTYLGVRPEYGLLDYLTSAVPEEGLRNLVGTDPLSPCLVIPGRGRSDVPTDQLIASSRMESLIEGLRSEFDIIVMDSPPVIPVVDARYLARYADAVVMIVRHATTAQSDVRESVAQFRRSMRPDVPLLTVLNLAVVTGSAYYRYRGYYSEVAS